ncbi:hypothetical protein SDC9_179199 [bioreactor metagenome]|uniref:Uncharacterized protein n=1 Tax=bioreactor metagenome TaxID=1076179 RepID=A0A645GY34_9ZZZZ
MPATPELGDVAGEKRFVEVVLNRKSHQAAESDHHVGVSGKVEIELKQSAVGCHQCIDTGEILRAFENPVHKICCKIIGKDNLFYKSDH